MEGQMRIPPDLKKTLPRIANHCLIERRGHMSVIVIAKNDLVENAIDKEKLVEAIKGSLPPYPGVVKSCCRNHTEQFLKELSSQIKLPRLYPDSYSQYDRTEEENLRREKNTPMKKLINELAREFENCIPVEIINMRAKGMGLFQSDINDELQKLKRSGDIYAPEQGFVSRL